tara:strand:- start:237 stop:362 length:126 start_codon:yes stop_codon:yes gene_type:complete
MEDIPLRGILISLSPGLQKEAKKWIKRLGKIIDFSAKFRRL